MIDSKHIEILNGDNRVLKNNKTLSQYGTYFKCRFVLYDTRCQHPKLYNINIYIASHCPYPYEQTENAIDITIRYKSKFTVNEFVKYLHEIISTSDNRVYADTFKHLLKYQGSAYSFMMACDFQNSKRKRKKRKNKQDLYIETMHTFTQNITFDANIIDSFFRFHLDLYFIKKSVLAVNDIKLSIKFAVCANSMNGKFHEVGFPLEIGINKVDNLGDIIDQYFGDKTVNITNIYHIKTGVFSEEDKKQEMCPYCNKTITENMYHQHLSTCLNASVSHKKSTEKLNAESKFGGEKIEIAKNEYFEYKPYFEFLAGYPDNYLLIVFKHKVSQMYKYEEYDEGKAKNVYDSDDDSDDSDSDSNDDEYYYGV